jgi:lysophospholipase L1-like esterase
MSGRIEELDEDADIVVLFGGTNDFGHGDAPLGTFADRTPYTFYGACHHIMTRMHERFPGKPMVILTPLHRLNEDNPKGDGYKAYNVAPLKTYVNIIREVAEFYSIPVLDLYAESGIQPKVDVIRELYCPDGLHPNDAGHVLLAKKIFAYLKAM